MPLIDIYSRPCWLRGYGHVCDGPITAQHLINKSKFPRRVRERKPRLAYLLDELQVPVCLAANSTTKIADATWARKVLLKKLMSGGREMAVRAIFDELAREAKVMSHEFTIDGILAGPEPPYAGEGVA